MVSAGAAAHGDPEVVDFICITLRLCLDSAPLSGGRAGLSTRIDSPGPPVRGSAGCDRHSGPTKTVGPGLTPGGSWPGFFRPGERGRRRGGESRAGEGSMGLSRES